MAKIGTLLQMERGSALDSEYENGVADVLAYLAGDSAVVERNVRRRGRLSGVDRQIDVVATGDIHGQIGATLAVDAKRWRTAVDVADVGAFIDLVKDVDADYGLLVTNSGSSEGGLTRAASEGTVQVDVLPVARLFAWRPKGTFMMTYRVQESDLREASRALRRAGFRVAESSQWRPNDAGVAIEIYRHYGSINPATEVQSAAMNDVATTLGRRGIEASLIAHGLIVSGGTPGHRWLELTISGKPVGIKILAATEDAAAEQLDRIAADRDIPRAALGYVRPSGWPSPAPFPMWGVADGGTA